MYKMTTTTTKILRTARIWHKNIAAVLFIFFFIVSSTAILLAFKSSLASKVYHNDEKQKKAKSLSNWLSLDSLSKMAIIGLKEKVPGITETEADRIDARLDKGYVRFSFTNDYVAQMNAKNGKLMSIEKKAPEWILKLHDGELVGDMFKSKSGLFKTVYSAIMGLSLFFLTLSGFWMWYKPKSIKNAKKLA
jgi:uncharacterized iron-regulated membrane protein